MILGQEDFSVIKSKGCVIYHTDGWRYVLQASEDDCGKNTLYDFLYEEWSDEANEWVEHSRMATMWNASFSALAEAFAYLAKEEK